MRILEDDPNRIARFRQWFIGAIIDITKDPHAANSLLLEHEYDYIFLDHDLEDVHYLKDCPAAENTGLVTAEFLNGVKTDARIIIHSLNPAGRDRMRIALSNHRVEVIPFFHLFK